MRGDKRNNITQKSVFFFDLSCAFEHCLPNVKARKFAGLYLPLINGHNISGNCLAMEYSSMGNHGTSAKKSPQQFYFAIKLINESGGCRILFVETVLQIEHSFLTGTTYIDFNRRRRIWGSEDL